MGETKTFDEDLMIFDENLPLLEGAATPLSKRNSFLYKMVETIADEEGINISVPFKKLPKKLPKKLQFYCTLGSDSNNIISDLVSCNLEA